MSGPARAIRFAAGPRGRSTRQGPGSNRCPTSARARSRSDPENPPRMAGYPCRRNGTGPARERRTRHAGAAERIAPLVCAGTSAFGCPGRFRAGPGRDPGATRGALPRSTGCCGVPLRAPCGRLAARHRCGDRIDPGSGRTAAPGPAGMRRGGANRGHQPATAATAHSLQQPGTAVSHRHPWINAASGHRDSDYRCAGSPSVDPGRDRAARRGSDGHRPCTRAPGAGSCAARQ